MLDSQKKTHALNSDAAYHVSKLLLGDVEVIIPQQEVVSIESIHQLKPADINKKYIGKIYKRHIIVPVYYLSDSMEILHGATNERSKCVVIKHHDGDFSVLCQDIQNVVLSDMRLQTLPQCMNSRAMPLTHLCLYKDTEKSLKLGLVTDAECLNKYIKSL